MQAESLYEAAVLAIRVFRHDGWIDVVGTAARLEVQVLPSVVTHTVSLLQVRRWLDGAVTDPADAVRATFEHIIFNMEVWSNLMAGAEPLPTDRQQSVPAFTQRLDRATSILSQVARDVAARDSWDETWLDVLDDPPVRKSYGGAIGHVITHSMHHRAQLLWMRRQLGLQGLPEGDVLSWERHAGRTAGQS